MMITLNGKQIILPEAATLNTAITQFSSKPEHVIAEVNGMIIDRSLWKATTLNENYKIELVTFVGGG